LEDLESWLEDLVRSNRGQNQRDIVETEVYAAMQLNEGESLTPAHIGAELAAAHVHAQLRGRALK
jgi:hypothetical protein